jgi:uncharacterized iron-regulated membrane protein
VYVSSPLHSLLGVGRRGRRLVGGLAVVTLALAIAVIAIAVLVRGLAVSKVGQIADGADDRGFVSMWCRKAGAAKAQFSP